MIVSLDDVVNVINEKQDCIVKVGNKWRIKRLVENDDTGVIRKVGSKWRILKKNRKDYWPAKYDTKSDAEAALRAYWANKNKKR